MFEQTPPDNANIKSVDKGLAYGRVRTEWSHVQLATGNGEIERLSRLRCELDVELGRKGRDLVACDAVCPVAANRLDVRGDERVNSLGKNHERVGQDELHRHQRILTSVVDLGKHRLLVPESKITVRLVSSVLVVLPLTEIPVEGNSQLPLEEGCVMKVNEPLNFVSSTPPRVNSAWPTAFGVRNNPNCAVQDQPRRFQYD
jgi:hypothetical protein